jgi:hypothetical protein
MFTPKREGATFVILNEVKNLLLSSSTKIA